LPIELQTPEYCREIEAYLCRKNDGHLIRVTGPSFDLVAGWAERGVPIKVAFKGIDRYFERYYRNGPRRRPVRIDFCEADVLDVFDEWRRATGVTVAGTGSPGAEPGSFDDGSRDPESRHASLPEHLKRVLLRLTSARSAGTLDPSFDELIDRAATELDAARSAAHGLRGAARQALIDRLESLDREFLQQARALLDDATRTALDGEADGELAPFRSRMGPEAFAHARDRAIDRLVRERCSLPVVAYRY
jgi:hypothetical protein